VTAGGVSANSQSSLSTPTADPESSRAKVKDFAPLAAAEEFNGLAGAEL
jgi:hypothetical protein